MEGLIKFFCGLRTIIGPSLINNTILYQIKKYQTTGKLKIK
jgi:hypothetical protein